MFNRIIVLGIICLIAAIALYVYNLRLIDRSRRGSVGERRLWRAYSRSSFISVIFLLAYLAGALHRDDPKLLQLAAAGFLGYCLVSALLDRLNANVVTVYLVEE